MKKVYGFRASDNGLPEVIPKQAAAVQEIYRQYLSGKGLGGIADFLFEQNLPSPSGKGCWSNPVLDKMLSNVKSTSMPSLVLKITLRFKMRRANAAA